jgi:PEGA domain
MKKQIQKTLLVICSGAIITSCASSTMINSVPNGAKLYLDGESVGTTPYRHKDTKIVGSQTDVKMEKDGFETFNTSFSRNEQVDVGAVVGGLFLFVPFLWTMKYKPTHNYELTPIKKTETNQK